MQNHRSRRRGPTRVRSSKERCRRVVRLLPSGRPVSEDAVTRAIAELGKAQQELETELTAMQVRRAREVKRTAKVARNLRDARGQKRGIATMPGYHTGRVPATKGKKFEKTPPSLHEIFRMLELAPSLFKVQTRECPICRATWRTPHTPACLNPYSERIRAWMYLAWRGALRNNCELLKLTIDDLHPLEGYLHITAGKGGEAGDVGIDDWVWPRLEPWLRFRAQLPEPDGPLFCVIEGPTSGWRQWCAPHVRKQLHALAHLAKVRRRCAPHQLRHACAVQQRDDKVDIVTIQRHLRHKNLAVTTVYLESLSQATIIEEIRHRPMPKISLLELLSSTSSGAPTAPSAPDLMAALAGGR